MRQLKQNKDGKAKSLAIQLCALSGLCIPMALHGVDLWLYLIQEPPVLATAPKVL